MNLNIVQQNDVIFNRLANYFLPLLLTFFALYFYTELSNFHAKQYIAHWQIQTQHWKLDYIITTKKTLQILFMIYAFVLFIKVSKMPAGERKGRLFIDGFSAVISGHSMTSQQKQVYLAFTLKFFFVPFIVNASIAHLSQVNYKIVDSFIYYGMDIYQRPFFYKDLFDLSFKLIFAVIFTVDVLPFLFGYLIDSDKVDNKIKSVEYTVAGWFFCLICYPPFNTAFGSFLPSVIPETIQTFKELPNLHYVLTGVAAALLALYASASVSLGFKGSNLTSRGVVSSGLYGIIRHPAYICKNAAWWVFSLSWAYQQHEAHQPYLFNLLCLAVWSWIYYMRAITEERHMSASDPEYQSYCCVVRYRFIPNII